MFFKKNNKRTIKKSEEVTISRITVLRKNNILYKKVNHVDELGAQYATAVPYDSRNAEVGLKIDKQILFNEYYSLDTVLTKAAVDQHDPIVIDMLKRIEAYRNLDTKRTGQEETTTMNEPQRITF